MALEIVGEVCSGLFRFIVRFIAEAVFEILVLKVGFFICQRFSKNVKPNGLAVVLVGLLFWFAIIFAVIGLKSFIDVDRCLDSGGRYNYQIKSCEYE